MNREPIALVLIVVFLLNRLLDGLNIVPPDDSTLEATAELILLIIGGLVARTQVASGRTVNKAGFTMDELERRADDPQIQTKREP